MQNFDYYNPTHIVFGENRLSELDKLVPQNAKVMITFGGESAKKYGTIEKVTNALKGREVIEFGGIEPNPQFDTLVKAMEIAKEQNVEFLLAVGGGSVMDGTKFIALGAKCDLNVISNFGLLEVKNALPLGCIATLPATGSEMNMGGVITYKGQKRVFMSPLVFPKFSFLDPELTLTLPKEQIANGVADAFIHVVEQYLTFPVDTRVQDRMAEGILKTLIEIGKTTYEDNTDLNARKNFMWSATNALNGIIATGVPQDWSTHMIGHEITALFGIAHGRTLAVILPSLLRVRKDKKSEKLLQFAERVWGITQGSKEEKIELAIDKTEEFFNSIDIQTHLSEYNITENDIEKVVTNLENVGNTHLSESGDLTLDVVREILQKAM